MTRVLVVDDDIALQRALRVALQVSGYDVIAATTGEAGLVDAASEHPDVVVLDLGLPDVDGIDVCRGIREWSDVPIIVLSAADEEPRKVKALDAGADDYVTKPFGMAELEARLRTALRRRGSKEAQPSELVASPIRIDLVHHQVELDGSTVRMTAREFDVLSFLVRHQGKVCTHQMILDAVWGGSYSREHGSLHAYIHRLRDKLASAPLVHIENSPGIGYTLTIDPVGIAPSAETLPQ